MKPYKIKILETRKEIGGMAKTVVFDIPESLKKEFAWVAGQHLTVSFNLGGEELSRCYTISESPASGEPIRITVKRVKGGVFSNYINDEIQAGDTVALLPPSGAFQLNPDVSVRRTHYFIGAGSGITPLFAMLKTVLLNEPHSQAHLLFANRNDQSIIFAHLLEILTEQYPDRLTVSHVLSSPRLLSSFSYWKSGKIDAPLLQKWLAEHPPYAQDCQYFFCGPGSMNRDVKAALQSIDVPENRIHFESFGSDEGAEGASNEPIASCAAEVQVTLRGETHKVSVAAGETLLAAIRAAGLEPPFSCQSGVCGKCKAILKSGTCEMKSRAALDDTELATNNILTCQSLATSEQLEVMF